MKIKSILEQVSSEVFQAQTLKQGQQVFIKCIESHNIKEEDKKKLIMEANKCLTLLKLQQYLCNAILKFEGMSLNTKKEK